MLVQEAIEHSPTLDSLGAFEASSAGCGTGEGDAARLLVGLRIAACTLGDASRVSRTGFGRGWPGGRKN